VSDDEDQTGALPDGRVVPFSAETIRRFARSKGLLDRACELCGAHSWDMEKTNDDGSLSGEAVYGTIPDNRLRSYYGAYLMICDNCGNIRFLYDGVVINWVRAND
jgi:hypothetical protein